MTDQALIRWPLAVVASAGVHAGALGLFLATAVPERPEQQPLPKAKMEMASYAVERSDAQQAEPDTQDAAAADQTSPRVGSVTVPVSLAEAVQLPSGDAAEIWPEGVAATSEQVDGNTFALREPEIAVTVPLKTNAPKLENQTFGDALPEVAQAGDPIAPNTLNASVISAQSQTADRIAPSDAKPVTLPSAQVNLAPVLSPAIRPELTQTVVADTADLPSHQAFGQRLDSAVLSADSVEIRVAEALQIAPVGADSTQLTQVAAISETAPLVAQPSISAAIESTIASTGTTEVTPLREASVQAATVQPDVTESIQQAAESEQTASVQPSAESAQGVQEVGTAVDPATPKTDAIVARLAWTGGDTSDVGAVSLAAIQSFLQEGDVAAGAAVRDGIEGTLAQVPCSRIQAAFRPESGALELVGHIPEDGLRGPVLAAIQAQMGADISVRDNLLILPRPQCGALAGISAVGLPQSTDQDHNPLLVGDSAHATTYEFRQGQRLAFGRSQAPDYPSYIYLDYFDAAGQVIHLAPNERVPLEKFAPKIPIAFDPRSASGQILDVTIGPPYGQEIAVAFAASVPVYQGVRPLVEPAGPYLEFLKARIAEARAATPDFKGEWVYFFVSTKP